MARIKGSKNKVKAPISKQEIEVVARKAGNNGIDIEDLLRQITSNLTTIKRLVRGPGASPGVDQVRQQLMFRTRWGSKLHHQLHLYLINIPVEKDQTSPVQVYHLDGNKVEGHPHDIRNLLRGTGCCDENL